MRICETCAGAIQFLMNVVGVYTKWNRVEPTALSAAMLQSCHRRHGRVTAFADRSVS